MCKGTQCSTKRFVFTGGRYTVVSGCPIPNGTNHANVICNMALDIWAGFKTMTQNEDNKVLLKAGIHTGMC